MKFLGSCNNQGARVMHLGRTLLVYKTRSRPSLFPLEIPSVEPLSSAQLRSRASPPDCDL